MNLTMTQPCAKCPFRTDIQPFITAGRAREIADAVTRQQMTFQCHNTVDYSHADDDGEVDPAVVASAPNAQHCAGALIMLEHMEQPNQMMRWMERLRLYDRTKLKMDAPVFTSTARFIRAHQKRARR